MRILGSRGVRVLSLSLFRARCLRDSIGLGEQRRGEPLEKRICIRSSCGLRKDNFPRGDE